MVLFCLISLFWLASPVIYSSSVCKRTYLQQQCNDCRNNRVNSWWDNNIVNGWRRYLNARITRSHFLHDSIAMCADAMWITYTVIWARMDISEEVDHTGTRQFAPTNKYLERIFKIISPTPSESIYHYSNKLQ